ncbi:hypothetical protein Ae201684P_003585 [Aphanomyces euteiches]|nr:hypothetical protein Ae201684P_003585 [Aphanomyces euteiches]
MFKKSFPSDTNGINKLDSLALPGYLHLIADVRGIKVFATATVKADAVAQVLQTSVDETVSLNRHLNAKRVKVPSSMKTMDLSLHSTRSFGHWRRSKTSHWITSRGLLNGNGKNAKRRSKLRSCITNDRGDRDSKCIAKDDAKAC